MTGDELYEIVETYAAFGDHHTATRMFLAASDGNGLNAG